MIYINQEPNGHADEQKVGSMETGTSAMEWVFNGSNQNRNDDSTSFCLSKPPCGNWLIIPLAQGFEPIRKSPFDGFCSPKGWKVPWLRNGDFFFLSFFDLLDPEKKGWDRFFHFRCWGAKLATRGISSRSYRELNPDGLARICVMKIGDTTDL